MKGFNKTPLKNYNLAVTLTGGQSFAWDYIDGWYYGFTKKTAIKLKNEGEYLYWQTYPKKNNKKFLEEYLQLNIDYNSILQNILKDIHMRAAHAVMPHTRILKQDFEETLLCFMASSNNTIKNIRNSVRLMALKLGRKVNADGKIIYLFPETKKIANAPLQLLIDCKLGFRAKFIKEAAQKLVKTKLAQKIHKMEEKNVREELKKIKGVGDKIADCVMVFGLGFKNVMPLDVWAKRVLIDLYKLDPKKKYKELREWTQKYFNGHAALAGQFLFEYIRKQPRVKTHSPSRKKSKS